MLRKALVVYSRLVFYPALLLLPVLCFSSEKLTPEHSLWLEDVSPIITKTERDVFLKLASPAERQKFIRLFWRARDPKPDTEENEFEKEYMERIRFADFTFGRGSIKRGSQTDRGFFYLLLGPPLERQIYATHSEIWPMELWFYKGDETAGLPPYFYLIFFQPEGIGDYRLYSPAADGPGKLVVPLMYGNVLDATRAVEFIERVSSELASAAVSYLPQETPFGTVSLSSDLIIASIRRMPEKKFSDSYARSYLAFKDHVETEYMDRYLNAAYLVKVFRQEGISFIHWAIEPDRMNFAGDGQAVYAAFELVLRIEDSAGRPVFERTTEIPVRLTPEQYKAHERQRFSFQDFLPVIPGEFKLFMLLKNKTGKEFSTFETKILIPEEGEYGIGRPLLFLSAENVPDSQVGKSKAFLLAGRQYVAGARNEFEPGADLGLLFQVRDDWSSPAADRRTFQVEIFSLDSGQSAGIHRLEESFPDPGDPETRTIAGVVPLASLPPGYYRAEVSVKDAPETSLPSQNENFVILSARIPVTPWIYARLQPEVPSAEHLMTLGHQYFLAGDYQVALSVLEKVLGQAESPEARLLLARSFYGLKRFQEALESALAVYEKSSGGPYGRESAKVIALSYAGLKDWAGAVKYLEELLAEATEVSVLNLAAECYMNMGQPEKAGPLISKSLALVPDQPDVKELEKKIAKISGQNKRES